MSFPMVCALMAFVAYIIGILAVLYSAADDHEEPI